MISEWRKQHDAERIAASQFKVGTFVAVVSTHWHRRIDGKRKVLKVYKNGNFVITTVHETESVQQWRPDQNGTTAHRAGERAGWRDHEHLEPWSPAIEAEIAERKAAHARGNRISAIVKVLERSDAAKVLTDEQVAALEQTLGLDAADQNSPRSDGSMDTSE